MFNLLPIIEAILQGGVNKIQRSGVDQAEATY